MGGGVSKLPSRSDAAWADAMHMMPHYYTKDSPSTEDVAHLRFSWNLITTAQGYHFKNLVKADMLPYCQPCLSWFYNAFIERLKLVAPHCTLVEASDIFASGKILIHIILLLQEVYDPHQKKFRIHIQKLFRMMTSQHLTFYDLSIFGDVFLYTLNFCLRDDFTPDMEISWKRVYSALLCEVLRQFCATTRTERLSSKSIKN